MVPILLADQLSFASLEQKNKRQENMTKNVKLIDRRDCIETPHACTSKYDCWTGACFRFAPGETFCRDFDPKTNRYI